MHIESFRVERLRPEDWDRFRRIRLLALAEAPYAFGATLTQALARSDQDWRDLLAARTQFLGTADGHDLGTVGATPEDTGAHLISMWVAPEARGTGLADLLVASVVDWAITARYPCIRLEVSDGNAAAERLYHRHGFRRTGVTGTVAPEDPRPEFQMRLTLPRQALSSTAQQRYRCTPQTPEPPLADTP